MLYFWDNLNAREKRRKKLKRNEEKLFTLTACLSLPDDDNGIHP